MAEFDRILDPERMPAELEPFKGRLSPRFFDIRRKVIEFIKTDIIPNTARFVAARAAEVAKVQQHGIPNGGGPQGKGGTCPAHEAHVWSPQPDVLYELQEKAKARGLFNFFLPEVAQLSVLEYSPIAEILGAVPLTNISMNCSAPDTGNMEVLQKYGSPEQKKKWLEPLLEGRMRSSFVMTEPGVASSDATNISASCVRDGDEYVINGHKWFNGGAMRPECKVFIMLVRNSTTGPIHKQQSMMAIPRDTPGITILRPVYVFGRIEDNAEILFDNVRVPVSCMILGEGRGFEIAQGRLGPGRIHHCMRTIGTAENALAAIIHRAHRRTAFGHVLAKKDTIRQVVAEARLDITKSRLLCYLAAVQADEYGFKAAKAYIAMTKVDAPRMCCRIIDEAIQIHGAHGVSQDSRLSGLWMGIRTLRVADGPDIVHLNTVAKEEFRRKSTAMGEMVSGTNKNIEKYGKFKHVAGSWSQLTASL